MSLEVAVLCKDKKREAEWIRELHQTLDPLLSVRIIPFEKDHSQSKLVFLDASIPDVLSFISQASSKGRVLVLVVEDADKLPPLYAESKVDDVLVRPFRGLEVLSKLRQHELVLLGKEIGDINASFSELLNRLQEDLRLSERLQKSKLARSLTQVHGLKMLSRYLAGVRSGGDFFNLSKSRLQDHLSLLLTHSTTYGLSTAVLSALMRVAVKLSATAMKQPGAVVQFISDLQDDLLLTLGERDELSLFYGSVFRPKKSELVLRFIHLGSSGAFLADPNQDFRNLGKHADALSKKARFSVTHEAEVPLFEGSRLVLVSPGYVNLLGGPDQVQELLNEFRAKELADTMNEFTYRVQSAKKDENDLPPQDSTIILFDLESDFLRALPTRGRGES